MKCPKCGGARLVVFAFNGKSYCNDYVCRDCEHEFVFSKGRNRFYKVTKSRKHLLNMLPV